MNLVNLARHILRIFLPFFFSTVFVQPRTGKQNPDHYTGSSHYDNNSFLFRCHGSGKQTIRIPITHGKYAVSGLSSLVNVEEGDITVVTLDVEKTS